MADYVINWPVNPNADDSTDKVIYDDRLWQWDGDKWVLQGSAAFIPVKGDTGLTGADGPEGPQGQVGPRGTQGQRGIQGPAGTGLNFLGVKNSVTDLPTSGDHDYGDSWVIENPSGHDEPRVYSWGDNNGVDSWIDMGPIVGAQGVPGANGQDGLQGPKGDPGEVKIVEVTGAPAKGPRGRLYMDSNNLLYVTTGV